MSRSETAALDAAAGMHDAVDRLRQLLAAAVEADARAFGKATNGRTSGEHTSEHGPLDGG